MGIPSVDLALFLNGTAEEKQQFVNTLGQAYEEIGFVAVKNSLISDQLISKLYHSVQEFFTLPLDVKLKYERKELAGQRGYTSFGKEHAKDSNAGDLKEFWHFGQIVNEGNKDIYPDNIPVDELPEFLTIGLEAYKGLENTGRYMLRAIALHLGLEENWIIMLRAAALQHLTATIAAVSPGLKNGCIHNALLILEC
jgi:isopenicillin N synthase-like dioxygenase